MALEQRKMVSAYVQEHEIPEISQKEPQKGRMRKIFSSGEKVLFILFTVALVAFSSVILYTESQLDKVNREVQFVGKQIEVTQKQNTELSIQVQAESTYEKVWKKAEKFGLSPNDKNVKVVPGR